MKNAIKSGIFVFIVTFSFLLITNVARAVEFNPNFIISDAEYLDNTTMTVEQIQTFLNSMGGYLATYKCPNAKGIIKSAAEIIYDAAVNNYDCDGNNGGTILTETQKQVQCKKVTINPKLLLVLLQKEMSLITDTSPTPRQLDWAVGYGCPDNQACNTRWQGFGKQLNSAALQFFDYMQNPQYYTYKAGGTYTVTNTSRPAMVITPINQGTASLYNYTPHVYNGNFNFYNLWNRYFTHVYPNGTLMQVKGEAGVWLIQNGVKRAFLSKGALTSRFDINKIITVTKSDIDSYLIGTPIKFSQYSIVRSPRGTVFLIVDDTKRGFTSQEAFRKIGYNPEEIISAGWEDLDTYKDGKPITATSTYLTGALLQNKKTGGVFWVTEGTKAPIWDRVLLKTKYKFKSITPVEPAKLDSYLTVEPAIFNDGELLKSDASPAVYVIDNKTRRSFVSGTVFENLGYKWKNVINVPDKILKLYTLGEPMQEIIPPSDNTSSTTPLSSADTNATSTSGNIISTSTSPITSSTPLLSSSSIAQELENILNP
jgi:hypothetical protein